MIDSKKSKEHHRQCLISERLRQRAKDLLSVITLHEMSFTLFEMKPISYDVYMNTFGKSNYVQCAVQTFDDGIEEEVQTDYISSETKWTQYPVKFSKEDIFVNTLVVKEKNTQSIEDLTEKFTFLVNGKDVKLKVDNKIDDEYKNNPLRLYFEQKDGVGKDVMLPVEEYQNKLKNIEFSNMKLKKFLKKAERKVTQVLTANYGNAISDFSQVSKLPFSRGYKKLTPNIEMSDLLKSRSISRIIFSETKNGLLITIHNRKRSSLDNEKCLVCLWDLSVPTGPCKVMIAIDNVNLGLFRGDSDGIFIGSLEDG